MPAAALSPASVTRMCKMEPSSYAAASWYMGMSGIAYTDVRIGRY